MWFGGGRSHVEVYDFENVSGKPIDAFSGKFVTYDKLGKKQDDFDLEWQEKINGKQFYLVRLFDVNGDVVAKIEYNRADIVKDFGSELNGFEKSEMPAKYEFRLKKTVLAR